jgi:hypothetical protein
MAAALTELVPFAKQIQTDRVKEDGMGRMPEEEILIRKR